MLILRLFKHSAFPLVLFRTSCCYRNIASRVVKENNSIFYLSMQTELLPFNLKFLIYRNYLHLIFYVRLALAYGCIAAENRSSELISLSQPNYLCIYAIMKIKFSLLSFTSNSAVWIQWHWKFYKDVWKFADIKRKIRSYGVSESHISWREVVIKKSQINKTNHLTCEWDISNYLR